MALSCASSGRLAARLGRFLACAVDWPVPWPGLARPGVFRVAKPQMDKFDEGEVGQRYGDDFTLELRFAAEESALYSLLERRLYSCSEPEPELQPAAGGAAPGCGECPFTVPHAHAAAPANAGGEGDAGGDLAGGEGGLIDLGGGEAAFAADGGAATVVDWDDPFSDGSRSGGTPGPAEWALTPATAPEPSSDGAHQILLGVSPQLARGDEHAGCGNLGEALERSLHRDALLRQLSGTSNC